MQTKSWTQRAGWGLWVGSLVFVAVSLGAARKNLLNVLSLEESRLTWIVVMDDENKLGQTQTALKNMAGVKDVELVSRQAVWEKFHEDPSLKPRLDVLKVNPFHSFFRIAWKPAPEKSRDLHSLEFAVRRWPGVGSLKFDPSQAKLVEDLRSSLGKINIAFLAGTWGLGLFLISWWWVRVHETALPNAKVILGLARSSSPESTASKIQGVALLSALLLSAAVGLLLASPQNAGDALDQKEERLQKLQRMINEKRREAEAAEQEAGRLKMSLEKTGGTLNRSQRALLDARRQKVAVQKQARKRVRDLEKTASLEQSRKDNLMELWRAYEISGLQNGSRNLERPPLLAMALDSQTQLYQESSQNLGLLQSQVESLKNRAHQLTREELKRDKERKKVLRDYHEQDAQVRQAEARGQNLQDEILALKATAAELTKLVNSLRQREAVAAQKTVPQITFEKLPLAEGSLPWPVPGRVLQKFGKSLHPELGTPVVSNGLTLHCSPGTPIRVIADGKVLYAGPFMSYGRIVLIEHPGDWHSIYGQLGEPLAVANTLVKAGETIGQSLPDEEGRSVAYFEIRIHGKPVDPSPWLKPH